MKTFLLLGKPIAGLVALASITLHVRNGGGVAAEPSVQPPGTTVEELPVIPAGSSSSAEWLCRTPDPSEPRVAWNTDVAFCSNHGFIALAHRVDLHYMHRNQWRRMRFPLCDGPASAWSPWDRFHLDLEAMTGHCETDTAQPAPEDAYSERVLAHLAKSLRITQQPPRSAPPSYGIRVQANPYPAARAVQPKAEWATKFPEEPTVDWELFEQTYQRAKLLELSRTLDSLIAEMRKQEALQEP